ncbi:GMC oxidoreductase [Zopfia rhizophila CBS 207.26]|uniref:GMC oxidoreductase n=1 Tax=Zopfia rhizophila CBS 207.26 TaxID=1314779 RepID=A0A6A6E6J2_9PEZI|nr:GMC oxidoreductase [Zopfia rhizophila CBS 207.26]
MAGCRILPLLLFATSLYGTQAQRTSPYTDPGNGAVPLSNSTYDYIVVGGGASGIITAQRLVETGKTVLLLERGGPSYFFTGGDLFVPWNDTVTAYEVPGIIEWLSSFPGMDGYCNDTAQVAGCILGGGTTVNGMGFIRPPSFDFGEMWPQGWQWTDVEPSAARFYERNPGTTSPSADGKYYDNAVWDVMSKELSAVGWKQVDTNDEPDEKFQIYSYPATNVANGRRSGPISTYLPLAMGKENFKLQLHTKVIQAVRQNSTITGVEVEGQGQRMIINVNQGGKVILAAGAMSSPRILFNSGIGPTEQIDIVKSGTTQVALPPENSWINLPIGFVRDHVMIELTFNTPPKKPSISSTKDPAYSHTSSGTLGITPEGNTVFTESPYLRTDTDKEAMALAIDEFLAMSRRANSTLQYNGPANATGASIVASSRLNPGVHMTGTTIMGTDDGTKNGTSVVDPNCKVYGTDNSFVVDAGMHADLPTGNTQAIVMVAAEHAVQRIIALDDGKTKLTGGDSTYRGYSRRLRI